jgi:CRP-like cAMP-binding protein
LTQQELATMVGATRESTNKALAAFRRQGLAPDAPRPAHLYRRQFPFSA